MRFQNTVRVTIRSIYHGSYYSRQPCRAPYLVPGTLPNIFWVLLLLSPTGIGSRNEHHFCFKDKKTGTQKGLNNLPQNTRWTPKSESKLIWVLSLHPLLHISRLMAYGSITSSLDLQFPERYLHFRQHLTQFMVSQEGSAETIWMNCERQHGIKERALG